MIYWKSVVVATARKINQTNFHLLDGRMVQNSPSHLEFLVQQRSKETKTNPMQISSHHQACKTGPQKSVHFRRRIATTTTTATAKQKPLKFIFPLPYSRSETQREGERTVYMGVLVCVHVSEKMHYCIEAATVPPPKLYRVALLWCVRERGRERERANEKKRAATSRI